MQSDRRCFLKQLGYGAAGLGLVTFGSGCRSVATDSEVGAVGRAVGSAAGLPRANPETMGVSSNAILAFLEAARAKRYELHSLMLVRHGHIVAEGWWAPYRPEYNHTLYSLSKSFTSSAVGFAVAEGRLSVDDQVLSFFPKARPSQVSDNLAAMKVKHLLSMATGHTKDPTGDVVKESDWVSAFLSTPVQQPPGSLFVYNSVATYMLSAIVQARTGQRIVDYLQPRLFEPLGIAGQTWEVCPRGINVGGWGLSVQTESLAKFGELYLRNGLWKGRQVLPASWVREATTFKIQQPFPATPSRPNERNDWLQGYCYQFWRSQHNAFRGDGAFGQFALVMPEQDAVFVLTSECGNMQGQLDLVWEHLYPGIKPEPLPQDREASKKLADALGSLALALPGGALVSPAQASISGGVARFDDNELGLQGASFRFDPGVVRIRFIAADQAHTLECGLGRWKLAETALPGTPPRLVSGGAPKAVVKSKVAIAGAWKDDKTFEATLRYYETPHHDTIMCRFEDGKVTVNFMNSIAAMGSNPTDKRPVLRGRFLS